MRREEGGEQSPPEDASQTSQTTPQATPRPESDSNPPPAQRPRPNNPLPQFRPPAAAANDLSDLHFNVGMPWHFLTHHRAATQQHQAELLEQQRQLQHTAASAMVGTPLIVGL